LFNVDFHVGIICRIPEPPFFIICCVPAACTAELAIMAFEN
jgi:hypothetical protein